MGYIETCTCGHDKSSHFRERTYKSTGDGVRSVEEHAYLSCLCSACTCVKFKSVLTEEKK